MDDIRAGRVQADAPATALLFEGLDLLRNMNRRVASEDYRESDVTGLVSRIARLKAQASEKSGRPEIRESPGKKVDVAAVFHRSALQQIEYMRESANRILQGDVSEKNRPNILRILKSFHVSANYGGFQAIAALLDEMKRRLEHEIVFGEKTAGYLLEKCEELLRLADEIGSREGPSGKTTSPEADAKMDDLFREVRLSPPKIDRIIDVATRMGIAHSRLSYLVEHGRDIREGDCVRDELKRTARQIGRITQELQVGAMALRLASINMIFERLPRIVRDIGLEEGKKVDLALSGADVELDRKVVEQLVDPLIHLVRNAVDHGIESPARRGEKGKPERGAIAVSASHEGNRVVVEVSDDGQGIDPEEIRRTAMEKKMFSKEKIDSMSSGDLLNLLFMPGYTTASCETKVSGRGVGLDIVKNNLKSVGGNVTVSSTPGAETRVRLQVPVSHRHAGGPDLRSTKRTLRFSHVRGHGKYQGEEQGPASHRQRPRRGVQGKNPGNQAPGGNPGNIVGHRRAMRRRGPGSAGGGGRLRR